MVVSPQSPVDETQTVRAAKINMASKQSSVADTRAELAELVKRKAEVAVRMQYLAPLKKNRHYTIQRLNCTS